MAKKKKSPMEAALEYVPKDSVLMGLKSAIPEPEPKPSMIGKIIKAPFRLVAKVVGGILGIPIGILRTLFGGLRRSR